MMNLLLAPLRVWLVPRGRARPAPTPAPPPRPARRVSRRAVLWGLGAAAGAQLGLSAVLETARPDWRDPEYGLRLRQVLAWQRDRPDRPLVLVLGTSRAQGGVSHAAMSIGDGPGAPLVYNFGLKAHPPVRVRLAFERMLADGVRPAFVLMEIFPVTLGWGDTPESTLVPLAPRLTAGDLRRARAYCGSTAALDREWAAARAVPWHTHRATLMSHWRPEWLPYQLREDLVWKRVDPYGCEPPFHDTVSAEVRARMVEISEPGYRPSLAAGKVSATQADAVRGVLDRCRREGVPAALFLMPEGPVFRSWYGPRMWPAVGEFLDGVRREYGAAVFLPPDGFVEDDFADSHHILRTAAARYSARLWEDHLRGWLGAKAGG